MKIIQNQRVFSVLIVLFTMKKIVVYLIFISVFISCQHAVTKVDLKPGIWKGILLNEKQIAIPFNFKVEDKNGTKYIEIINADERLRVDELYFEGDSLRVIMPMFDSEFVLKQDGEKLKGRWIKHLANKDVAMEFYAAPDDSLRFGLISLTQTHHVKGRWDAFFPEDSSYAVGEFEQNKNNLKGTFLTTTGDYRFLEGVIKDDSLFLSCFDGSHAYLFTAKIENDETLTGGKFYSGKFSETDWHAVKNENAKLPDADALTFLKDGYDQIAFSFPDLSGKMVSLSDEKYKNKVVVVQIMGSWCPNCMDETAYLSPYYDNKKSEGFEIIGLAYERSSDLEKATKNLGRVTKRFNVHYDILFAGTNEKGKVNESLPMLKNFMGYPTTIIIDKKGKVRKIHTGFSGPATGKHFEEFKKEFETYIDQLIKE
jgi:peroxiredoxin